MTIMFNTLPKYESSPPPPPKKNSFAPIEIVNKVYPLTKEDNQCGFRKAKKLRARNELIILINQHRDGKKVILPEQILKLLESGLSGVVT